MDGFLLLRSLLIFSRAAAILHDATKTLSYSVEQAALKADTAEETPFFAAQKEFSDQRKAGSAKIDGLLKLCQAFQLECDRRSVPHRLIF